MMNSISVLFKLVVTVIEGLLPMARMFKATTTSMEVTHGMELELEELKVKDKLAKAKAINLKD